MKARTGILLGCAGVAVLAVLVAVIVGAWVLHVAEDPEGLWLTVDVPERVKLGEKCNLVIKASNRLPDRDLELGDLDISSDYLKGFTVLAVRPDPKSTELDDFIDVRTTRFDRTLKAGTSAEFVFELRAETAGRYQGQVDQYVGVQFASAVVTTTVTR
jgi:hypothetical protein